MRKQLSDEEREIRWGRGIPFRRYWPIVVMVIAIVLIAMDTPFIERCIGVPMKPGKGAGIAGALLAVPCSVFLPGGSWWERSLFALLWLPLPFAILNWRWMKRNELYWGQIRTREAERRAERRRERERR